MAKKLRSNESPSRENFANVREWISRNANMTVFAFVVSLIAIYQTCENNKTTEKSANDSKRSADIAQEALALQHAQTVEAQRQDSIADIQDSIKSERFIELTERQILALKQQANALERGVRNTEITQRPYLDVARFGFHIIKEPDSVLLSYKVINYGIRPAVLKTPMLYVLNEKFEIIGDHKTYANTSIIEEKTFQQTIGLVLNDKKCSICNINDILKAGSIYFCFIFEFNDPFISEKTTTVSRPIYYKWIKKNKSELLRYEVDRDAYYAPDLCTNEKEIAKIDGAIKLSKRK